MQVGINNFLEGNRSLLGSYFSFRINTVQIFILIESEINKNGLVVDMADEAYKLSSQSIVIITVLTFIFIRLMVNRI